MGATISGPDLYDSARLTDRGGHCCVLVGASPLGSGERGHVAPIIPDSLARNARDESPEN